MQNNKVVAEMLDIIIREYVKETKNRDILGPPIQPYHASDNIGELIEKLVILHIRVWNLEDAVGEAKTDEEIADLKRKIDYCFKVKRPQLVAAINDVLNNAVIGYRDLKEDSMKLYKGYKAE